MQNINCHILRKIRRRIQPGRLNRRTGETLGPVNSRLKHKDSFGIRPSQTDKIKNQGFPIQHQRMKNLLMIEP